MTDRNETQTVEAPAVAPGDNGRSTLPQTWGANLIKALARVQAAGLVAKRNSANPYFKSSYADLAQVWETCRVPLQKNGLCIMQVPLLVDGRRVLRTILAHESGEYITADYEISPVRTDPQSMGSAYTYARRYSLAPLLGVVSEGEDDDGNRASAVSSKRKPDDGPDTLPPMEWEKKYDDQYGAIPPKGGTPTPPPTEKAQPRATQAQKEANKGHSPYWMSAFARPDGSSTSYLFAREGRTFSPEWLKAHGFERGQKCWRRAYDEKIEILCAEVAEAAAEREPGEEE